MKKVSILSIAVFALCTAFNPITTDYRDSYIGTYTCNSVCYQKSTVSGQPPQQSNDILSVQITKDVVDSVLQLKINERVIKVKLQNKHMYAFENGTHGGGDFFASDSINFSISMGRANSCKYVGKKKP